MPSLRSSNLNPLCLEDIFDQTPTYVVVEISTEITYLIEKYTSHGISAATLHTIFSFYAANMMLDIQEDARKRVEKRLEETTNDVKVEP